MLVWILFYLILLFVLIFLLVVPLVKSYKEVHSVYQETRQKYMRVQNRHENIQNHLKNLQVKYRKVVSAFENRWNERDFVNRAGKYFLKVALTPIEANITDSHFKVYKLNVSTKMKSPQNFYRFIDALSSMPYVVQTDFPIAFKANGGDEIEGVFRIYVYEERSNAESNRSKTPLSKR